MLVLQDYVLVDASVEAKLIEEMQKTITKFFGETPQVSLPVFLCNNSIHSLKDLCCQAHAQSPLWLNTHHLRANNSHISEGSRLALTLSLWCF